MNSSATSTARPGPSPRPSPNLTLPEVLKGTIGSLLLFSMFVNLLALTGPIFMLQVYDRVLSSGSVETLVGLAALMAGLYGFFGLLEWIRGRVMSRVGARLDLAQSGPVALKLMRADLAADDAVGLRPSADLGRVRQFVSGPGVLAIFDLPWVPIYLLVVWSFHPLVGAVVGAAMLFLFALTLLNEMLSRPAARRATEFDSARAQVLETARTGVEALTSMGMRGAMFRRWRALNDRHGRATVAGADISGAFLTFTKTFRMFLQSAILGLGAFLAIGGEMSPGMIIAVSTIAARALAPIEASAAHWRAFVGARQAWGRLRDFLAEPEAPAPAVPLPLPERALTARDTAIAPFGAEKAVLSGLNFTAEAGEVIGVVGNAGAGKTALARGLTGVWPVVAGAIRLDGAPLEQWSEEARGDFLGYVPQTVELFDGTAAENIARFSERADEGEVLAAARLAGAHEMIVKLPQGYETPIARSGSFLSGGQRQLLALARAVYRLPFMVVLDEPNANLDKQGHAALVQLLATLRKAGKVAVLITHDPRLLAHVDKILVIEGGRQIGFGPRSDFLPAGQSPGRVAPDPAHGRLSAGGDAAADRPATDGGARQ